MIRVDGREGRTSFIIILFLMEGVIDTANSTTTK